MLQRTNSNITLDKHYTWFKGIGLPLHIPDPLSTTRAGQVSSSSKFVGSVGVVVMIFVFEVCLLHETSYLLFAFLLILFL